MFSDGVELKSYIVDISIIYESFPSTSILTNIYWISIFADLFLTVQAGGPAGGHSDRVDIRRAGDGRIKPQPKLRFRWGLLKRPARLPLPSQGKDIHKKLTFNDLLDVKCRVTGCGVSTFIR